MLHVLLCAVLCRSLLRGRLRSQLASLRKECGAALQAVADAGLGRWVKLLAARSAANTRLRQYELRQLLDLSEQVRGGGLDGGGSRAHVCGVIWLHSLRLRQFWYMHRWTRTNTRRRCSSRACC